MKQNGSLAPRLTIVHVCAQLDLGGLENLLVDFARHADRNRFDLHFLSMAGRGALARDIESLGWPVSVIERQTRMPAGLISEMAEIYCRIGADIVHTHNNGPLIYGVPAAKLAGVRAIIHTRHGTNFGETRCQRILVRAASALVDRVVCVSANIAELSVARKFSPRQTCAIRNGVDIRRISYTGPVPSGPAVVVARLTASKDIQTLIHATALVVAKDPSFRLHIAGDGPCREELVGLANQLKMRDHVRFLGVVRDIPALLREVSVFVLPSLTEGLSIAILEAMAAGLPVISTRVGGTPELVLDGETGLLIPTRSPEVLAEAIRKIRSDPKEAMRMGTAGRKRVERFFDIRQMIGHYERIYLDLLRCRSRETFQRADRPAATVGAAFP